MQLYEKYASKTRADKSQLQEIKRKTEYSLVDMDQPKKKFIADQEVYSVKKGAR